MKCTSCGYQQPAGKRYCTRCGTRVVDYESRGTLQKSLDDLGIGVSPGEIVGFVIAVLAGMAVARVLPKVYRPVFAPLLNFVFGQGISFARDTFNMVLLSGISLLTSFLIAFHVFRKH